MEYISHRFIFATICLVVSAVLNAGEKSLPQTGTVVTYPAPQGESVKGEYSLTANGREVAIYRAQDEFNGKEYFFAYFDCDGKVEIKVESSKHPISKAKILPEKFCHKIDETGAIKFTVTEPFKAIITPDGVKFPLVIFANPIEKNVPKADDKNVVYFGTGVHKLETPLKVKSGQTVYLAGGCVLKGAIAAEGDNISIRGRGILDGAEIKRFGLGEYFKGMILAAKCRNFQAEGIIVRNSFAWTFVTMECDGLKIDNVKICGSRMLNDDAFDLCDTRNAEIRDCFARAQDDIIAVKGMTNTLPCENILVEDCIFWSDKANIFRIGYESDTPYMRNMTFRNIYVPFYSSNYVNPEGYWSNAIVWLQPAENMPMENIDFENISVHSNGNDIIMLSANPRLLKYKEYKTAGVLKNCRLENISVHGEKGKFTGIIYILGFDKNHDVDGIQLKNISYFGEKITPFSKCMKVGNHTKNITIE